MSHGFFGLPTGSLSNDHLRVDYLAGAGPRIVRLALAGSDDNLFAEIPDASVETDSRRLLFSRRASALARAGGHAPHLHTGQQRPQS